MPDEAMDIDDLKTIRGILGITQSQMAGELGLKLRAYQDVESGNSPFRQMHVLAAERIVLRYAAKGRFDGRDYKTISQRPWFKDLLSEAEAFGNELA